MAKFDLKQLMNDTSKGESGKDTIAFKIDFIPINKIQPSEMNKYSVDDVQELKLSIELTGLQQNLLVRQRDGADKYEIISGHRRFKALQELNAAGNENFSLVPCKIIKSLDDIQAELQLIFANSTSRRLTDYEITYQAGRLKDLLTELKNGGFKFTGRTREVVAELLHVSPSQIGRMESINNNLLPELKDEFKQENINITTAYELSKLEGEQQEQALNEHKNGVTLTPDKVKQRKEKPNVTKPLKTKHELSEPRKSEQIAKTLIEAKPDGVDSEFDILLTHGIYPDELETVIKGLKILQKELYKELDKSIVKDTYSKGVNAGIRRANAIIENMIMDCCI